MLSVPPKEVRSYTLDDTAIPAHLCSDVDVTLHAPAAKPGKHQLTPFGLWSHESERTNVQCDFPPQVWDAEKGVMVTVRQPNKRKHQSIPSNDIPIERANSKADSHSSPLDVVNGSTVHKVSHSHHSLESSIPPVSRDAFALFLDQLEVNNGAMLLSEDRPWSNLELDGGMLSELGFLSQSARRTDITTSERYGAKVTGTVLTIVLHFRGLYKVSSACGANIRRQKA